MERVYYKHTGALGMRIQEKKDSLEGKEMERGAEREGVTEEIDAVFAVCWLAVISVSQVQCLWCSHALLLYLPFSLASSGKKISLSQFPFKVLYILYYQSINMKKREENF